MRQFISSPAPQKLVHQKHIFLFTLKKILLRQLQKSEVYHKKIRLDFTLQLFGISIAIK
jgi:hypothetical protein